MKHMVDRIAAQRPRAASIAAAAAAVLATAVPAAQAASPAVSVQIDAGPKYVHGRLTTSMMHLLVTFSTDPPGGQPFTVQQGTLLFPDHTYGRFFPSCDAAQIQRFAGNVGRCPKGSKIGGGHLTAQVLPAGIEAEGRVTLLNSHHGRGVTFNIQTTKPAVINESFDASLTSVADATYPMKLVMQVPPELQQVLPGLFVGLETFDVTISGVITTHGRRHHYLPLVCPTHGLHAEFGFLDWTTGLSSTAATDADLRCKDLSNL